MSKKMFLVLSVILVFTMVLSACAPNVAETAAPTAVPATLEPAPADITLRWRTRPDNQAEIDVYSAVSSDLEAAMEGVKLVYEPGGSET